jgi:hypothetical protein
MVLMYSDPAETMAMSASDRGVVGRKHEALRTELTESGELLNGAGLAYPMSTRTIRMREGLPVAVAGPLVEAKVQLTAYYVIDCENAERALSIAESVMDFHVTAVEIREVHDSLGMDAPE